ncbi:MAG: biopolymer transporter ExbB [Pseudomonadota bacterium]
MARADDLLLPEPETAQFSRPIRQIVQMLVVLLLVGGGVYLIYPNVAPVFLANPFLNGMIGLVFVVGVLACFWQVVQLLVSVRWIEEFVHLGQPRKGARAPRLLAPLAALLRSRGTNRKISSTSATSILDSLGTRIEEARDITRYLVSLLIFLGLLGTFYGLATVVPGVVETIRSLAPQDNEGGVEIFNRLMSGLETQLQGMGTAFGSSLLGLAGSLVVGLLELYASRGQNRFYRELEEWLTSITRLGFSSGEHEAAGEVSAEAAVVIGVLEQMAEQMDAMREMVVETSRARALTDDRLAEVATAVTALTRQMEHGDQTSHALMRVADGQETLIGRLAGEGLSAGDSGGGDPEARMRLRSIDVQLLRILEELAAGRQETVADIRADLGQLVREIRRARGGAAGGPGGGGRPGERNAAAGPGE